MEWGVVAAILALGTAASMLFIGVLWSAMMALGQKRYLYGIAIIVCFPVALAYCLQYRQQSKDALKFLLPGLIGTALCAVPMVYLSGYLTAIG
ncbi:hypothetical protein [uncultured Ferrimonas sp.]|uniref:hypothetical protein n=1 Tax=uncultured Ferrimonas sp. TaxID=432640 RepID=UPI002634E4C4|nr:hypothetical protein [uncultured Ferrimonas sp.]